MKQSFYDWCMENNRKDLLDRWDYDLNKKSPKKDHLIHVLKHILNVHAVNIQVLVYF